MTCSPMTKKIWGRFRPSASKTTFTYSRIALNHEKCSIWMTFAMTQCCLFFARTRRMTSAFTFGRDALSPFNKRRKISFYWMLSGSSGEMMSISMNSLLSRKIPIMNPRSFWKTLSDLNNFNIFPKKNNKN